MATRLLLLVVIAAAVSIWWWQHDRAQENSVAALESAHDEAASKPPPQQEAAPPAAQSYYRFVDAGGTLRFVDSIDKVPDAQRASARPVTMRAGGDKVSASERSSYSVAKPSRASRPPPRKPFSDTWVPTQPYQGQSSANSLSDD